MLMNKLLRLTLLAAALSASSSHTVIKKATRIARRLIPLFPLTHLKNAKPPIIPPQRCLKRNKSLPRQMFVAEVVTQYFFDAQKDVYRIVEKAQQEGAIEVHWYEKDK
jgi:hypothetical protein